MNAMTESTRKDAPPIPPATNAATVRMYRDILGDCFLLRFPGSERPIHVLIDFGILQGMPRAKERAIRIAKDIASITTKLDVVVATHEHVDHLSGFAQASMVFEGIEIEELWLAWTEDPRDELAMRLRAHRRRAAAMLERSFGNVAALLEGGAAEDDEEEEDAEEAATMGPPKAVTGLLGLMSFLGFDPDAALAATSSSTASILEGLKVKAKTVRYLKPGAATFHIPGTDVTVYVLGPPRDEVQLKRSDPSRRKPEVYELAASEDGDAFLVAALAASEDQADAQAKEAARRNLPFGQSILIPFPGSESLRSVHASAAANFEALYSRPEEDWRRIDADWLGAAEQLALKLDSDTNNTSLVLAFEVGHGADAKVLLFPGDAQVGNWLSWGDLAWPPTSKKGDVDRITIDDLFARTVLYKVGHHCSHNATLRERGLELMTHRDLVALIPVHEEFARKSKNWNMPFPSLLARLNEMAAGRVLRADRGKSELENAAARLANLDGQLTSTEWAEFLSRIRDVEDDDGNVAIEYSLY